MDQNELSFILKMKDQTSGALQAFNSSIAGLTGVIEQQVAAMQQLTAAMNSQAGAARTVTAASRAQVEGLKAVDAALAQNTANAAKAEASNKSLAASLIELKDGAASLVGTLVGLYAANSAIKAPLDAYRAEESSIRKIGAAAGLTAEKVHQLHDALDRAALSDGKATITQFEQYAQMGAKIVDMGGSIAQRQKEIEKFATSVGGLAKGDLGMGDQISQILTSTQEGAKGAAKLVDALKTLSQTARSGLDGLVSMTSLLGNFTAGIDISSAKLVAYAATFDKTFSGRAAHEAAMEFGMTLQNITKQADEGGVGLRDLAERFHMTYEAMQQLAAEHPDEVFERLLKVVNALKAGGQNPTDFLKEFGVGGGRAVQTMTALAAKSNELNANLAKALNPSKFQLAQNAADESTRKLFDQFTASLNKLSTSWTDFQVEVGKDIAPTIITFLNAASEALQLFTAAAKGADPAVRGVVEALIILGPVLSGVTRILGLLGSQFKGIMSLFDTSLLLSASKAGTAMTSIAGAETALVAGSAARWDQMGTGVAKFAAGAALSIFSVYESFSALGGAIGNFSRQWDGLKKAGLSTGDIMTAIGGTLPSWLGGDKFYEQTKATLQAAKDAGHPIDTRTDEQKSQALRDAAPQDLIADPSIVARERKKDYDDAAYLDSDEHTKQTLAPFEPQIKNSLEYRKAVEDLNLALLNLSDAQKKQFAAEIEGAQQTLALRKAELDPLNKMKDDWAQALQSARAFTAAQQEQADIEKKVFDARQQALKDGRGTAGADTAESEVRKNEGQINDAKRAKSFQEQLIAMNNQLALAGALTQADKDRLQVDQQIAALAKDQGYSKDQLAQLQAILDKTKEIEERTAQFKSLNPQAEALQNYNEQLALLNKNRAAMGETEYNREKTKLDNDTLAQRDPLGNIAQQNQEQLDQLKVVGQYREADLKTLQEITSLQKQGISLTKDQADALSASNRAMQDVQDMQKQLDSLADSFGSGLSNAISGALSGQKYAFQHFAADLGKKMMDSAFSSLSKSLEGALSGANGPLSFLFGNAQKSVDALKGAGKSEMEKTIQTAQATITANSVTVNGAVQGVASATQAATAAGTPSPLTASGSTASTYGNLNAASAAFSGISGLNAGGRPTADALTQHMMQTYGLTREQAVGVVGVMGYESGNFQTLQERGHSGTNSGWGYAQWTGPRRTDFEQWSKQQGLDPSSYAANQGFLDHELQTNYKGTIPALKDTNNPQDAARAFEEHYEGMREGGPGVPAFAAHQARAQQYYNEGVGQNVASLQSTANDPMTQALMAAGKRTQSEFETAAKAGGASLKTELTKANTDIGADFKTKVVAAANPGTTDRLSTDAASSPLAQPAIDPTANANAASQLTSGLLADASKIPGGAPYAQGVGLLEKLFGGLFGGGGTLFGALHSGGVVGQPTSMSRYVSPAIFRSAQRFHDGLGDDEFPVILQRGERVLTANQDQRATAAMSRMADMIANSNASTPAGTERPDNGRQGGRNQFIMNVNTPNASSFRNSQSQIMAQQHAAASRHAAKNN